MFCDNCRSDGLTRAANHRRSQDEVNNEIREKFIPLDSMRNGYRDSVQVALGEVAGLRDKVKRIAAKDVITQNIFIVDQLSLGQFPADENLKAWDVHIAAFKDLRTISGQKLPKFKDTPTIMCSSPSHALVYIYEVTRDHFKFRINPDGTTPRVDPKDLGFSVWITQKTEP